MIKLAQGLYQRLLNSKKLNSEWNDAWYKTIVMIRIRTRVYFDNRYLLFMSENEPLKYFCELLEDLLKEDPELHLYAIRRITSRIKPGSLKPCTPAERKMFDKEIEKWLKKGGMSNPPEINELDYYPFTPAPIKRQVKLTMNS